MYSPRLQDTRALWHHGDAGLGHPARQHAARARASPPGPRGGAAVGGAAAGGGRGRSGGALTPGPDAAAQSTR